MSFETNYPGIETEEVYEDDIEYLLGELSKTSNKDVTRLMNEDIENNIFTEKEGIIAAYLLENVVKGDYELEEAIIAVPNSDLFDYNHSKDQREIKCDGPELSPYLYLNELEETKHKLQITRQEREMRETVTGAITLMIDQATLSYSEILDSYGSISPIGRGLRKKGWDRFKEEHPEFDHSLMEHWLRTWTISSDTDGARSKIHSDEQFHKLHEFTTEILRDTFGDIEIPLLRGIGIDSMRDIDPRTEKDDYYTDVENRILENGLVLEREGPDSWGTRDVTFYADESCNYGVGFILRKSADIDEILLSNHTAPIEQGEMILDRTEDNSTMRVEDEKDFRIALTAEKNMAEKDLIWMWKNLADNF